MNTKATNQTIVCIICFLSIILSGCSISHLGSPGIGSKQSAPSSLPGPDGNDPDAKEAAALKASDLQQAAPNPFPGPVLRSAAYKSETALPAGSATSGGALLQDVAEADAEKVAQPLLDEALNYCEVSQEFWQKGELENAVDALDQAYSLILTVDTADHPKLIQQKEDLRFLISRRILEIHASRNIVVNGNFHEIPVVINRHVRAEIDNFTTGSEREFFIDSYIRSGRYRAYIVSELQAAGLP